MSVLSLAEAKDRLKITGSTDDAKVQDTIDEAEAIIAEKCGPLTSVSVTERVRGSGRYLTLRETPIVSLTSITPVGGTAYTVADFDVDESAGVIEWGSGAGFAPGRYDVVYQAGRAEVPDDLRRAIKDLVHYLWSTGQRGAQPVPGTPLSDSPANTIPGAGHHIPFSVQRWISSHEKVAI